MEPNLEAEIVGLKTIGLEQLRAQWRRRLKEELPACRSREVLRRLLAWRIQEKAFGGLASETRRQLKKLAKALPRNPDLFLAPSSRPKPGTVLVREWKGVLHRVQVLQEGFEYAGERFASLSEVARRITGTRWSGPLFFGLKSPKETNGR